MEDKKLRVAILTGNELRHMYFVDEISKYLKVVFVAFEKKANIHEKEDFGNIGNEIVKSHFDKRKANEGVYFNRKYDFSKLDVLNLDTGEVNSNHLIKKLISVNPQYILLFGCSLISEKILNEFNDRVINLHLGLSPYYRGSGTLFWPLVDNLPECVGSTIHLAVKKIDAGGILAQVRPIIHPLDSSHDIGNKTIIESVKKIPKVITEYHENTRKPIFVNMKDGKLCLRKHLTPSSIKVLNKNFEAQIISKFLENSEKTLKKYPIIT